MNASRARGFTLIELMVAVLITTIIAMIGYTALNQATRNREQVNAQAARVLEIQRGLRALEQDIELLAPRPVREPLGNGALAAFVVGAGGTGGGSFSGGTSSMAGNTTGSLTGGTTGNANPASYPSNLAQQALAILSLTRGGWANPAGVARTEGQRVNYLMENGTLVRYHLPVLDAAGEVPTVRRELIHGVESIAFRFMDAGHAWQTSWLAGQATGNPRLPSLRERPVAVEVTIKLRDWGTITRIIEVAG